jgi:hypothetical protein
MRILHGDLPGYIVLDLGTRQGADCLRLSLRSKRLRPGLYLAPGGLWRGAPHFFEATRLGDQENAHYRLDLGPGNSHDLTFDIVEIADADRNLVETVPWSSLAFAASPSSIDTGRARPMAKPGGIVSEVLSSRVALPEETPFADYPNKPNPDFLRSLPRSAFQERRRSNWWLFAASSGLSFFLITLTTSFLFCSPFATFCSAELSSFELALKCAESKPAAAACEAQRCFDGFFASPRTSEAERREGELLVRGFKQTCERLNDDEAVAQARECFASRISTACETSKGCLDDYASKFPNGAYRTELERTFSDTMKRCEGPRVSKPTVLMNAPTSPSIDLALADDETAFDVAKKCEAEAQSATKAACYDAYLSEFPQGAHAVEAREAKEAVAQADMARIAPVSDGLYKGFAVSGCNGEGGEAINVAVQGRTLRWEHYIGTDKRQWVGRVEPDGTLSAKAQGYPEASAVGHFSDEGLKEIDMRYPECKAPIQARFYGRRPE